VGELKKESTERLEFNHEKLTKLKGNGLEESFEYLEFNRKILTMLRGSLVKYSL